MNKTDVVSTLANIEARIQAFAHDFNLAVANDRNQRILTPLEGTAPPENDTELYVSNIPTRIFEDEILRPFLFIGTVARCRMMLTASGCTNRGFCYIQYVERSDAETAIVALDNREIAGVRITVRRSLDNRRIFVGGVDETKNKTEVWRELEAVGMRGIVDVIMYRSYIDRAYNRGFVFIEFASHTSAALARSNFRNLILFGNRVFIDWSTPLHEVDSDVMNKVKKLFLRNLPVMLEREAFTRLVIDIVGFPSTISKVYKCRDYAFIHFVNRRDAQRALALLREHYYNTDVEVTWAKPPPARRRHGSGTSHESSDSSPPSFASSSSSSLLTLPGAAGGSENPPSTSSRSESPQMVELLNALSRTDLNASPMTVESAPSSSTSTASSRYHSDLTFARAVALSRIDAASLRGGCEREPPFFPPTDMLARAETPEMMMDDSCSLHDCACAMRVAAKVKQEEKDAEINNNSLLGPVLVPNSSTYMPPRMAFDPRNSVLHASAQAYYAQNRAPPVNVTYNMMGRRPEVAPFYANYIYSLRPLRTDEPIPPYTESFNYHLFNDEEARECLGDEMFGLIGKKKTGN